MPRTNISAAARRKWSAHQLSVDLHGVVHRRGGGRSQHRRAPENPPARPAFPRYARVAEHRFTMCLSRGRSHHRGLRWCTQSEPLFRKVSEWLAATLEISPPGPVAHTFSPLNLQRFCDSRSAEKPTIHWASAFAENPALPCVLISAHWSAGDRSGELEGRQNRCRGRQRQQERCHRFCQCQSVPVH